MIEPLFFRGPDGGQLSGVWRLPTLAAAPTRVWVVCPPFAEEEKSAHRTLVELADSLVADGDAVFFLAYRGTGDSDGDFAIASLTAWRQDIAAALAFVRARFPNNVYGLLGLRLGASLAVQLAAEIDVQNLLLIEPVLRGSSFLMQLGARKKLRAAMTEQEAGGLGPEAVEAEPETLDSLNEDLDGWPIGIQMRDELNALSLNTSSLQFFGKTLVLQIAPREKIAPPLEQFAKTLNPQALVRAVVMPAFWNRLDLVDSSLLIQAVKDFDFSISQKAEVASPSLQPSAPSLSIQALTLESAGKTIVAVHHHSLQSPTSNLVFLHGWTGYRTGPHQMLARAARQFVGQARCVLRFDFAGRGDSEGEAVLSTLATMADDARAAIRFARSRYPEVPVILVGLCSGCEIAFAVADEPGVAGLVLWSAPVFAAGQSNERVARKRSKHLKDYARKLLRPATWGKVLSGRLDVKGIRKVVKQGGGEEFKNAETGEAGHLPQGWRSDAMQRFEKVQVPSLLIYGTADPTTPEALAWYRGQLRTPPEVHLIEGANHSYYGLKWEDEVFRITEDWLSAFERVDK
jgi:pimeloyl-ACP methyl ester carboxylesterase